MHVVLIVIYNHKYDKNIEIIEAIYKNRFSNIYHLVPFYTGSKANVIPVYENSLYFQGYVSQGLEIFFDERATHYFFVADDMLINPEINENNYSDYFKLTENKAFIPDFFSLYRRYWPANKNAFSFRTVKLGLEVKHELPSYEEAEERLLKNGAIEKALKYEKPVMWQHLYGKLSTEWLFKDKMSTLHWLFDFFLRKKYTLNYPLVASYSDIFIVPQENITQFCHYCGAFAALELFVEVAIPSALALSVENIVTGKKLSFEGKPLWETKDYELLLPYKNNLELLMKHYPDNVLYIHPVKLSQWDCSFLNKNK
jgi:hypothetical protein